MARTRNLRLRVVLTLLVCAGLLASCRRAPDRIILATTSSVGNSGLLDELLPRYPSPVQPLLVGSGRAIEMLAAGQADVIISHAPGRESEALRAHPSWFYRKILFNDFVLVGPADDPAGVAQATSVAEAMRRIVTGTTVFLSRGDESGTHDRERELWSAAGTQPPPARLVIAGAGMGQTLRIASSTGAYTLTDRSTFETLRGSLSLVVLFEGDQALMNTYAVIADSRHQRGLAFAEWLAGRDGQAALDDVLAGGVRGFTRWPSSAPADHPAAIPDVR